MRLPSLVQWRGLNFLHRAGDLDLDLRLGDLPFLGWVRRHRATRPALSKLLIALVDLPRSLSWSSATVRRVGETTIYYVLYKKNRVAYSGKTHNSNSALIWPPLLRPQPIRAAADGRVMTPLRKSCHLAHPANAPARSPVPPRRSAARRWCWICALQATSPRHRGCPQADRWYVKSTAAPPAAFEASHAGTLERGSITLK